MGHSAGDRLIVKFAGLMRSVFPEKDKLNNTGNELQIDYACGWAISEDYKESTIQILFDSADSYMYKNKQICKK